MSTIPSLLVAAKTADLMDLLPGLGFEVSAEEPDPGDARVGPLPKSPARAGRPKLDA